MVVIVSLMLTATEFVILTNYLAVQMLLLVTTTILLHLTTVHVITVHVYSLYLITH